MDVRAKASAVCNVFIAVMTAAAFIMMVVGWGNALGTFSEAGLRALKYFTVLSNLFSGIVSVVFAIALIRSRGKVSRGFYILKLTATVAVAVTFFTVVVLFEIIFGLRGMFVGANLWFHLVLPLVAMIEFCAFDISARLRLRETLFALLPVAAYGIGYYANIIANGVGEWPDTNDWYGFLSFGGLESAPIVFVIMLALTWLIALVVWGINRSVARVAAR